MESFDGTMVGREREREALSDFVTAAGGRALVLRGDTGVGKSALLDHVTALAAAARHQVVRAAGVEAESALPFAGLHQLLYPLLPFADRLDDGHREVFDVVFGRGGGPPPSVMTLGIAVLDLLSLAASRQPLLLALDDGQWFDTSSTEVCGFVGRRLTGSSVKLVVGLRSDVPSGFDTAALPQLPVPTLSDEASEHLLDLRSPGLEPRIRRLILAEAQGNPLALLELPPHVLRSGRTMGDRAMGDRQEIPGYTGIPLPLRLQHVYGARIAALGDAVRAELLRGALDGVGSGAVTGPGRGTRYRMLDADEAAACGLLDIDPLSGDFVFRHPLVRSTVVQTATPNQRRAAHAALAHVHRDDVERRAMHLAASTVDPDERVAAVLEAAADSATLRGGSLAAVSWLTRAAELSERHEERSRRLASAAFIAGQAGLLDRAQQLVGSDAASGPGASPASVLASAYGALYEDGEVRISQRQVLAAIESIRDGGARAPDEVLTRLVNLLLAISQYASDSASWERAHALLASLGDRVSPNSRTYHDAWSDVVRRGAGVHERVEHALADPRGLEPWEITRLSVAAYHVDTLSRYRPHLQRTVDRELETGAMGSAMTMLHLIMLDQMAAGEWDEAERTGRRSLDLTTAHRNALFAHHTRAYLGLLAALRGRTEQARRLQAAVDAWARPRGVGFLTQIADAIGTTAALTEGDYEAAYLHAIGITPPGTFTPYAHQASRTLLDLVEAALHTGRTEQARRHARAAQDAGLPAVSPRLAVVTYGALAMTATDAAEADALYHRAETHPGAAGFPFEVARIRLAHGIRLRHTHGRQAARATLTLAAEAFERLDTPPWAEGARAELRASGASAPTSTARLAALTWQERRIADLAAGGLTNKEIGARMHLSPRTVSSHLYRVFPKLGITSRAALRDALGKLPDDRNG
ncbi:helix-turn-helix transcriptional regulator [Streptomyces sp. NRRL B-1347]|uniref:helix-turn-helix transcriptional regulator n=1 Tax=Streptomyces sp. NRRL B-1347 TaxID=1476877 RepID=UPI0004CC4C6E|nr:AAA family ATPase [Streptomyces sp. NRRL B-1347]